MPKKPAAKAVSAKASEKEQLEAVVAESRQEEKKPERRNILDLVEAEEFKYPGSQEWSPENPVVDVVELTPGQCRYIIEKLCPRNRKVRDKSVVEYSDRMLEGSFEGFTGNQLGFTRFKDNTISLCNGQHQLRAAWLTKARLLANPDTPSEIDPETFKLKMVMVLGIDPDSVQLLDHGTPRTHQDVVGGTDVFKDIEEPNDRNTLNRWYSTAAKIIHFRRAYGESVRCPRKFQFHELTEIMHDSKMEWLATACRALLKLVKDNPDITKPQGGVNASYLVATAFLISEVASRSKANEFLTKIADYYKGGDEVAAERAKGCGVYYALDRYLSKNGRSQELSQDGKLSVLMAAARAFLNPEENRVSKPSEVKFTIPFESLGKGDKLGSFAYRWIDSQDGHLLTEKEIEERELGEPVPPKDFDPATAKGQKARFPLTKGHSKLERYAA